MSTQSNVDHRHRFCRAFPVIRFCRRISHRNCSTSLSNTIDYDDCAAVVDALSLLIVVDFASEYAKKTFYLDFQRAARIHDRYYNAIHANVSMRNLSEHKERGGGIFPRTEGSRGCVKIW